MKKIMLAYYTAEGAETESDKKETQTTLIALSVSGGGTAVFIGCLAVLAFGTVGHKCTKNKLKGKHHVQYLLYLPN